MTDRLHPVRGNPVQLQLDAVEEAQRAFGPDQDFGEIAAAQSFQTVAADIAQHGRRAGADFVFFAGVEIGQALRDVGFARRRAGQVSARRPQLHRAAVGQGRVDRQHVLQHDAVADRPRAAGIVGGHAADRGAVGRADVDREGPARCFQMLVEMIEHDAGLHPGGAVLGIQLQHVAHVFAGVEHQRFADRLATLGRAGAARQNRYAFAARDLDRGAYVVAVARNDHADRFDLIDRRVGRIAAAVERAEADFAAQGTTQARGERLVTMLGNLGLRGRLGRAASVLVHARARR